MAGSFSPRAWVAMSAPMSRKRNGSVFTATSEARATARRFIEKYQDRVLFGTDAVPPPDGENYPQQVFKDELYEIYFRFLETEDEYFDYAPAAVPPQGRWRIYGLGLPEPILKKVYHDNAARILGLKS